MALSIEQITDRLLAIETKLNEMQVAINKLATKVQLKSLTNIRQNEIDNLQTRVAALESQIVILQNE